MRMPRILGLAMLIASPALGQSSSNPFATPIAAVDGVIP